MLGEKHTELADWLADGWWSKGPPLALVSGFPGTGKTEVALQAMRALKQARPSLPVIHLNCIENASGSPDDLLLSIAEGLAAEGDREALERLEEGEDVAGIFNRILISPRLIVIDEAQRLLVGDTGAMPRATAQFLERWSQTVGAQGRMLLLSSREFDLERWGNQAEFRKLDPLGLPDAEAFLRECLEKAGRADAVPSSRMADVVTWLGRNPRAIKLLVSALARDSLDDLIGLATEAWEARDRQVSPTLLRRFEEEILSRAEERLDPDIRLFLARLSVLRQPAELGALEALLPTGVDLSKAKGELLARYMLELRGNRYEMYSVLRDTIRATSTPAASRSAHRVAGQYYAAPFRAKRTAGTPERLGGRFIEARYHFTLGEREADLDEISQRFEAHYRAQYGLTTPVPKDPLERDQRIALLSALLQARGAKGLEFHLARLLVARDRPGDVERALPHARRATGPQSPADAWVLRIRLEARIFGAAKAAEAAREGFAAVLPEKGADALYLTLADAFTVEGKFSEALDLLRRGLNNLRSELGSLVTLYQAAAKLLFRQGRLDEAREILVEGIDIIPSEHNVFFLYRQLSIILVRQNRVSDALEILIEGSRAVPQRSSGYLIEQAIYIASSEGCIDKLSSVEMDIVHSTLLEMVEATSKDEWDRAADIGLDAVSRLAFARPVLKFSAFALLSLGRAAEADDLLRRNNPFIEHVGDPMTWLRSFIALQLNNIPEATRLLEIHAGDKSVSSSGVTRSSILRCWDERPEEAAICFSRLTPRLTGLPGVVVRRQGGFPVFDQVDLTSLDAGEEGPAAPPPATVVTAAESFEASRALLAMRPDRWFGLYVLGCYDKTKTVYVQQCRALTLVHALFEADELRKGARLAVVGAGAAGLSAAAAAALKGAEVVLYEKASQILPLQRQNSKRFLHPHLFDWPVNGSTEVKANLPILTWTANRSDQVAEEISAAFAKISEETGNIELRLGVGIQDIAPRPSTDNTRRLQLLGAEGAIEEVFDVVILAIGFGIEPRNRLGVQTPPYWEDDGLNQALGASPERPQRILVSGAGDGALIDLLRATVRDFRHEDILSLLPHGEDQKRLIDEVLRIESHLQRAALMTDGGPPNIQKLYGELPLPAAFLAELQRRVRDDTEVWFNYTAAGGYMIGSSILNRLLVSALVRIKAIRPRLGRLYENMIVRRPAGQYAVTWPREADPQIFDQIVVRHGPPADYLSEVFPILEIACAPLRGKIRDLDLTSLLHQETRTFFSR